MPDNICSIYVVSNFYAIYIKKETFARSFWLPNFGDCANFIKN